jgi:hypothetical protein
MRVCSVCKHEKRAEIDRLIVQCAPERGLALRYGMSNMAIHRHKRCLRESLAGLESRHRGRVLRKVENLVDGLEEFAAAARTEKQAAAFVVIARELRATLALMGGITGEVQAAGVAQLLAELGVGSVDELRSALDLVRATGSPSVEQCLEDGEALLVFALRERPEARNAVLARLGPGNLRLESGAVEVAEVPQAGKDGRQANGNGVSP